MHHWIQLAMVVIGLAAIIAFFHIGTGDDEFIAGDFIAQAIALAVAAVMLVGAALWFVIGGILGG